MSAGHICRTAFCLVPGPSGIHRFFDCVYTLPPPRVVYLSYIMHQDCCFSLPRRLLRSQCQWMGGVCTTVDQERVGLGLCGRGGEGKGRGAECDRYFFQDPAVLAKMHSCLFILCIEVFHFPHIQSVFYRLSITYTLQILDSRIASYIIHHTLYMIYQIKYVHITYHISS